MNAIFIWFLFLARQPQVGQDLLIHKLCRPHKTMYEWSDRSRDLYLTTLTTDIHAPSGIGIHNLSRLLATDLRLRPCGHWDQLYLILPLKNYWTLAYFQDLHLLHSEFWSPDLSKLYVFPAFILRLISFIQSSSVYLAHILGHYTDPLVTADSTGNFVI
jgi:hypothetical protein